MRNTIESGEEILYNSKEIHFKNSLTVEGRVVFEDCTIYCFENDNNGTIELKKNGALQFINCEILFCSVHDSYFIDSDNGSLYIKNCHLRDLGKFVTGSYAELKVTDCEFTNCLKYTFNIDSDEREINVFSDCRFLCHEVPDYAKKPPEENAEDRSNMAKTSLDSIFRSLARKTATVSYPILYGPFDVSNCTFEFGDDVHLYTIDTELDARLSDCTFVNDESLPAEYLNGHTNCTHCAFEL